MNQERLYSPQDQSSLNNHGRRSCSSQLQTRTLCSPIVGKSPNHKYLCLKNIRINLFLLNFQIIICHGEKPVPLKEFVHHRSKFLKLTFGLDFNPDALIDKTTHNVSYSPALPAAGRILEDFATTCTGLYGGQCSDCNTIMVREKRLKHFVKK